MNKNKRINLTAHKNRQEKLSELLHNQIHRYIQMNCFEKTDVIVYFEFIQFFPEFVNYCL